MQPGFIESKNEAFRESGHHARNATSCPSGVHRYDWQTHKYWHIVSDTSSVTYRESSGSVGPQKSVPGFPSAPQGLIFGGTRWEALLQTYRAHGGVNSIANHPDAGLEARGKWKIDVTITIWRKRVPAATRVRDYLFVNLVSSPRFGPANKKRLILKGAEIIPGMYRGIIEGTAGVPAASIPIDSSTTDPESVNSTWRIDLTAIDEPTADEPYIIQETIIVPEQVEFCQYLFDTDIFDFGPNHMVRSTASGFFMPEVDPETGYFVGDPTMEMAGYGAPEPYGSVPETILEALAGEWDIDIPYAFASGVVPAEVDLSATYPGWNGTLQAPGVMGESLFRVNATAHRIPKLTPLFTASITGTRTIQFNDISLGGPVTWDWDFGDGTSPGNATAPNPAHTYAAPGEYTVTLTVQNAYGDSAVYEALISVPLVSAFEWTPLTYPSAQFTAKAINAVTYDWDFGDGTPHSNAANPAHVFPSGAGSYTVKLTVGDGAGHTAVSEQVVTLGPALVAAFSWASAASPAHTVQFTDRSTGLVVAWTWERQGTPTFVTFSNAQNPALTFSGTRLVRLTVRDFYGFTRSVTASVTWP